MHMVPYIFQLFFQSVFCWLWCYPTTGCNH